MKFLVLDPSGLFMEHSQGLTKGGHKVRYWTQFNYSFRDYAIGLDYGKLEKIMRWAEHVDWADCVVGFDVRLQDVIAFIREKFPKKSVFGSGLAGKLEDDRILLKKFVESQNLPIQNYAVVKGTTKLQEYLKKHPNVFVKTNIFRDDCESFYSKDFDTVESEVSAIADGLGAHKEEYDFIVEDCIDTDVEIGFDGFFDGKNYCEPMLIGYEYKKNLYLGKVVNELPPGVEETMSAFRPLFEKLNWRGALSTEEKIVSQKEHYLLDLCARLAHPFTAGYTEWIKNWPEFIYGIGMGEEVSPEFSSKYVGAFTLKSGKAQDAYIKVTRKDPSKVKLVNAMGGPKGDYAVKGEDHVAILIAEGKTPEEVIEKIKKNADLVDANGLDKEQLSGIDKIFDIVKEGKVVGIDF
jgi:hypothetical protein